MFFYTLAIMSLLSSKLPGIGTNIFTVMSQMATEHKAINLAQGFPDFETDPKLISLINKAYTAGHNQYAPMSGVMGLRERISEKFEDLYGISYDPDTEVTVTAGGTQAIFTAIASIISPGDEAIIFEPAYDCYGPTVKLFGGLVKTYEMTPPDFKIDWQIIKKLISVNTKLIILNSPHNPTGTLLKEEDFKELQRITAGTDILIISDEVYEHITFDGIKHLSTACFPDLKERSFIIASFGKLLHATGWKVGYCLAPAHLMKEFRKTHQFNVFSVNTPIQWAIADYLKNKSAYNEISAIFQKKRDLFRGLLNNGRLKLLPCNGSYFQCVSFEGVSDETDVKFAETLIKKYKVAGIPVSALFQRNTDYKLIRFCFAKKDETLEKAAAQLMKI